MLRGFMTLNIPMECVLFCCYASSDFGYDHNELLPCFRLPVVLLTRLYATLKEET
jgi:hypothetical protein